MFALRIQLVKSDISQAISSLLQLRCNFGLHLVALSMGFLVDGI